MAVTDFKKFFERRGRFVRQPHNDKKTFQKSRDDKNKKSDRKCFRCIDPNHLIGACPKPLKDKNQRAFVGGSWSDSDEEDDEKAKDETCLVAQASSEICLGVNLESDDEIVKEGKVIGRGIRKKGLYVMKLGNKPEDKIYLATIDENFTLWQEVYRNKLDENDVVSRNKVTLVAQGYYQLEGIDYNETYAPVDRLESIRILLAYAYALDFKLFQMDVKSAFLNGFINKEPLVDGDVKEVGDLSLEAMKDEEVAMVGGVFKGAFRALSDETCLLEGLEVEALVDAMEVMVVDDK
uniref:Copia protein n=1 Tax=Tanacetum cinerariifolium TaxID=118510 RepID=A0A6L2M559_TANCI|nr:copia protein [Tanacetum cinerariifolium]